MISFRAAFSSKRVEANYLRLARVQRPVAAVASGDGEHCPKVRSDEGLERNKLRSQAAAGRCRFTPR